MNVNDESYVIVIRAAGERTVDVCRRAILIQAPEKNIFVVNEKPFEAALRRCFEIGMMHGTKWLITIDADILLQQNAIELLIQAAEAMPVNYVQLQGRIFDKILGSYRAAGPRVYRTEILEVALNYLPVEGQEIRPEFHTLYQLASIGHLSQSIGHVIGLHDFEQYYFDLYRKAVVHAKKHPYLITNLITRCTENLNQNKDFLMILKGVWDGLTIYDEVTIDVRMFKDRGKDAIDEIGLTEKGEINDAKYFADKLPVYFDNALKGYDIPDFKTQDSIRTEPLVTHDWTSSVSYRIHSLGLAKGCVASFGCLLKKAGRYLDK